VRCEHCAAAVTPHSQKNQQQGQVTSPSLFYHCCCCWLIYASITPAVLLQPLAARTSCV
jgi:hypothetical protein